MSAASSASSWSHLSKDDTASVRSQAPKSRGPAQGLVDFINSSPNPYFAVAHASARLESTGFTRLNEREPWSGQIKPSGRYYVVRGHTSLIAFAVGGKFKPGNGISIVGAHTDSCCFKIRPISKKQDFGYVRCGVETYGGGLWHTWLDRDLGIAGRVITSGGARATASEPYEHHLIKIDKPLMRIPTLAIHLDREQNKAMSYNDGMVPLLALASSTLNAESATGPHSTQLLEVIAEHLGIHTANIEDFDLRLFDVQPGTLGGANDEFIFAGRLDNLFSTYCATAALSMTEDKSLEADMTTRMIALWDHEEVGSASAMGAESNFLESVIGRLATSIDGAGSEEDAVHRTIANSFLVSSDMGHAIHPAFPGKHEVNLRPVMNGGPAIKTNANQRYATSSETNFLLKRVARLADVPLQEYGVRNDCPCGSTIGPLASKIGLRTIDIGCAQLSMHSIRETAGAKDVGYLIDLLKAFHENYATLDKEIQFT